MLMPLEEARAMYRTVMEQGGYPMHLIEFGCTFFVAGGATHRAISAAYAAGAASVAAPDANVERVRDLLLERSQVGVRKYGCTTERTDLSFDDWVRHLQEELLDAAVYAEALLRARP